MTSLPIAHGGDPGDAEHAAQQWVEHYYGAHRIERAEVAAYDKMIYVAGAIATGQYDEAGRLRDDAQAILVSAGWEPIRAQVVLDSWAPQAARDDEDFYAITADDADVARTVWEHPSLPPAEPAMRRNR